jgi:hypothetical protein
MISTSVAFFAVYLPPGEQVKRLFWTRGGPELFGLIEATSNSRCTGCCAFLEELVTAVCDLSSHFLKGLLKGLLKGKLWNHM